MIAWSSLLFAAASAVIHATSGSPISAVAITTILIGLASVAPAIRRGVDVGLVAHALTALTWVVTFVVAWRTGGFASPAVVWSFFHPITMSIVCGRRAATAWSVLSVAQVMALFAFDRVGLYDVSDLSPGDNASARVGGFVVAILAIVLVIGGNEELRSSAETARAAMQRAIERQRLLGDMHDGVGSQLVGLIMQVRAQKIGDADLLEGLERCLDDMRLVVDSLDPAERSFLVSFAELRTRLEPRCSAIGIELRWNVSDDSRAAGLDPERGLQVLRTVQEAVTNALRHSGTDRIDVDLSNVRGADRSAMVELRIRDRGCGLRPTTGRSGGRGMESMRTRAERLGGELSVERVDPGTLVALRFPALPTADRAGSGLVTAGAPQ